MHSLFASIQFKGVWGERFKADPYGVEKLKLMSDIEQKVREISHLIDAGTLSPADHDRYMSALNVLYAARETTEEMWRMFN